MTRSGGTDWYALTAPLPWQTARLTASRIDIRTLGRSFRALMAMRCVLNCFVEPKRCRYEPWKHDVG